MEVPRTVFSIDVSSQSDVPCETFDISVQDDFSSSIGNQQPDLAHIEECEIEPVYAAPAHVEEIQPTRAESSEVAAEFVLNLLTEKKVNQVTVQYIIE